jgi:hypothetical protein
VLQRRLALGAPAGPRGARDPLRDLEIRERDGLLGITGHPAVSTSRSGGCAPRGCLSLSLHGAPVHLPQLR